MPARRRTDEQRVMNDTAYSPFGTSVQRSTAGQRRVPRLDVLLLLATLGLVVFSLVTLNGAITGNVQARPGHFVVRQAAYAVVGIALMLVLARLDYTRFRELRIGLYCATIGLILLVLAAGGVTRGSRRWLELPFFRFQPSELGKVLLVLSLSAFVLERVRRVSDREMTARIMLLALLPTVLVMAQPDLGTGIVYIAIALSVLFIAGTKWTHFAALGALATGAAALVLVVAPLAGMPILKGYQKDRLTAFLHKDDANPKSQGYQLKQATIAMGSGQKTGRGPKRATQTRFAFLPERHTDFVFATVGEQFGFVGAGLVLSLYALIIWRALRILTLAKNLFGALIAGAIAVMLMTQVFVNVGGNVGIMPITGIPLPLMSYGGSSVLVTLIALGLLQSVHVQAREAALAKQEGA
jgi:rod shape determining protein RodA